MTELQEYGCEVSVHDPLADPKEAIHEYGITLTEWDALPKQADAIVAAVAHTEYTNKLFDQLASKLKAGGVFVDIKSAYPQEAIEAAGYKLWRL